jgi:hypothetical protein
MTWPECVKSCVESIGFFGLVALFVFLLLGDNGDDNDDAD